MAKQQETAERDPEQIAQILAEIADKSQQLMQDLAERRCAPQRQRHARSDPLNLQPTLLELTTRLMADPAALVQAQLTLWQDYLRLWQSTSQRLLGQPVAPVAAPERRRPPLPRSGLGRQRASSTSSSSRTCLTSRWLVSTVNQLDGRRRQDAAEDRLLHAPVRRCDGAVELRRDQPRGAAHHARDRRREPAARPQQPARRPGPRQRQARDHDDRSRRLRARREHRAHARARWCSRPS